MEKKYLKRETSPYTTDMKRLILYLIGISFTCGNILAQDVHFSQFYNSPTTLNPASAGIIKGDFRVVNIYREQWKSITNPYRTYLVSTDGPLYKEKMENGSLGLGVTFYNDRAGDIGFNTNQFNVTLSANRTINEKNNFSLGLQAGVARRSIDVARLESINQFDGLEYHSNWPTGETTVPENFSYADFAVGLLWNLAPNEKDQVHLGIAMFHANSPEQSYYGLPIKSDQRLVIHGGGELGINEAISFNPDFLFQNQGEAFEIISGGLLRFASESSNKKIIGKAISIGGAYRFDDAFIALAVVEIAKWKIGFSYDVNTSGLSGVSRGNGGMEISLTFMTPNTFDTATHGPSFL